MIRVYTRNLKAEQNIVELNCELGTAESEAAAERRDLSEEISALQEKLRQGSEEQHELLADLDRVEQDGDELRDELLAAHSEGNTLRELLSHAEGDNEAKHLTLELSEQDNECQQGQLAEAEAAIRFKEELLVESELEGEDIRSRLLSVESHSRLLSGRLDRAGQEHAEQRSLIGVAECEGSAQQSELVRRAAELQQLQLSMAGLDGERGAFQTEAAQERIRVASLQEDLLRAQHECSSTQLQLSASDSTNNDLRGELRSVEQSKTAADRIVAEQEDDLALRFAEIQQLQKSLSWSEAQAQELQVQIRHTEDESTQRQCDLNRQLDAVRGTADGQRGQLSQLEAENGDLQTRLANAEGGLSDLRGSLAKSNGEISTLRTQQDQLGEQVEKLEKRRCTVS